jgi:hypothetical protein
MNITAVFEPNVGVSHIWWFEIHGFKSSADSGSLVLEYSTVKAERVQHYDS